MKVAAIVITYNDDYKLKEWVEHHQFYKNELFLHIIVDNGSKSEYLNMVEESFPDSHIIKRISNGGCTGAYNDGIRVALRNQKVDAIMLIGNDVKLEPGGITKLHNFLNSNTHFGMVAPVILTKDSDIIDDFGCEVSQNMNMKPYDVGKKISEVQTKERVVASVTGGMNMSTRAFYETVGLQDERLFMYSDEVDMAIRAKKLGFKMGVTSEVKSWHQHINENKKIDVRHPFSMYLIARNKVYLAKKHFGMMRAIFVFNHFMWSAIKSLMIMLIRNQFDRSKDYRWLMKGAFNGLIGNMKPNRFSSPC